MWTELVRIYIKHLISYSYFIILESALDQLRDFSFKADSPYFDEVIAFQPVFLDYYESTWVSGHFPPALWNVHNKVTNLTNNRNEGKYLSLSPVLYFNANNFKGLNSRINKMIMVRAPNENVLVVFLKDEIAKAELDVTKVQVCNIIIFTWVINSNSNL